MTYQLDAYLSGINNDQSPIIQVCKQDYENEMVLHFRNVSETEVFLEVGWEFKIQMRYGYSSGSLTTKANINQINFLLPHGLLLKNNHPIFEHDGEEGRVVFDFLLSKDITIKAASEIKIAMSNIYSRIEKGRTFIAVAYYENGTKIVKQIDVSKEALSFYIEEFKTDRVPVLGCPLCVQWHIHGATQIAINNELVLPCGKKEILVTGIMEIELLAFNLDGHSLRRSLFICPSGPVIKLFCLGLTQTDDGYPYCDWEVLYADKVSINGVEVASSGKMFIDRSGGGKKPRFITYDIKAIGFDNQETTDHLEFWYY